MPTKGKAAITKNAEKLEVLKIVYVPHGAITPNAWNPNRQSEHEFELLKKSMGEDGFTQPIVAVKAEEDPIVVQQDGSYHHGNVTIVDGYHRYKAAKELGYETVPVALVPMTLEQAKIATLRHNRARGTEDVELTAALLRDLREVGALDWAQDSLILDDVELQRMLDDIPAPEALASDTFSQAWEPDKVGETDKKLAQERSTQSVELTDSQGETITTALSEAAADVIREREEKLKEAKTAEERQMIRKKTDVYRINLTFAGDDALLVKGALGNRPAERLLEILRQYAPQAESEDEEEAEVAEAE